MTFQRDPYDFGNPKGDGGDDLSVYLGIIILMIVCFTVGWVLAR
jgi:hypothetical protein